MKIYIGNEAHKLERVTSPKTEVWVDGINIKFDGIGKFGSERILIEGMTTNQAAFFARDLLEACKKHAEQSIKRVEKIMQKSIKRKAV